MLSSHSPLFSPKNPANLSRQQLLDEAKSIFLYGLLASKCFEDEEELKKSLQQTQVAPADNTIVIANVRVIPTLQSSLAKVLEEFDRLLILRSRQEANEYAESVIVKFPDFADENDGIEHLKASYALLQRAMESGISSRQIIAENLQLKDIEELSLTLSVGSTVRAFSSVQTIMNRVSPAVMPHIKDALGYVVFRTMHFGDAGMFNFMLDKGVDVNYINTGDFLGGYRPLSLLVFDMERCIQITQKLMEKAQRGESLQYSTLGELKQFMSRRIQAYKDMITSLLQHGADPDIAPEQGIAGAKTPRIIASDYLAVLDRSLGIEEGKCADYQRENKAMATEVLNMIIHAPACTLAIDEEPALKRLAM